MYPRDFFAKHSALNLGRIEDQRILIQDLARVYGIHGAAASTFVFTHDKLSLQSEADREIMTRDLVPTLRERMSLVERAQLAEGLYRGLSVDDDPFTDSLRRYGVLLCIGALLTGNPCWIRKTHPVWDLLQKLIPSESKVWLFIETYEAEDDEEEVDSE